MDSQYKIVYSGRLRAGADPERFVREFAQRFGVAEEEARKLVSPGREVPIKSNLSQDLAEKYRAALEKMGMDVHVEPMTSSPATPPPQPDGRPAAARVELPCPKCGSRRVENDSCPDCGIIVSKYRAIQARRFAQGEDENPYAAPKAELEPEQETTITALTGPHKVPALNGWQWILGGWTHFRQNPGAWIGAVVIWMVLMLALAFIPLIGSLVSNLLMPLIMAGFMIGARQQEEGGDFEVGHLFAGFSANPKQLLLVGVIYLVGMVAIVILFSAIIGGVMFGAMGGMEGMQGLEQNPEQAAAMAEMMFSGPLLLAFLLMIALIIPLIMAYWFAPALVALGGMNAIPAMKASFMGCLRNILPFLVYGVISFALAIVASIPFALGWLVLGPVLMAAMYESYKDIYYGPS